MKPMLSFLCCYLPGKLKHMCTCTPTSHSLIEMYFYFIFSSFGFLFQNCLRIEAFLLRDDSWGKYCLLIRHGETIYTRSILSRSQTVYPWLCIRNVKQLLESLLKSSNLVAFALVLPKEKNVLWNISRNSIFLE
jgi:hypothetical protein